MTIKHSEKYSKKQIYRITARLYAEMKKHPAIQLKKLKGCGEYDYSTDIMVLDYRRDIVSTLIHELLHKWHPDKCETWVLRHEKLIINSLSSTQIKHIIKAFASALS